MIFEGITTIPYRGVIFYDDGSNTTVEGKFKSVLATDHELQITETKYWVIYCFLY